jgi:hypothetical protein
MPGAKDSGPCLIVARDLALSGKQVEAVSLSESPTAVGLSVDASWQSVADSLLCLSPQDKEWK